MLIRVEDTFGQETAELQQDERNRLLLAIVRYQMDGSAPELPGNERYLWPVYRTRIDREKEISQARADAGRRGGSAAGKQFESNESKPKQIEANRSESKQAEAAETADFPEKESTPEPLKEKESGKGAVPPEGPRSAKADKDRAEALFDRFWAAYPRKENKKNACRAFLRLRPNEALLNRMLSALWQQRASPQWLEAGGKYIPQASTWLNGERWEDQPNMAAGRKTTSAAAYTQRDYTEEKLDTVSEDLFAQARALRAEALSG